MADSSGESSRTSLPVLDYLCVLSDKCLLSVSGPVLQIYYMVQFLDNIVFRGIDF